MNKKGTPELDNGQNVSVHRLTKFIALIPVLQMLHLPKSYSISMKLEGHGDSWICLGDHCIHL